MLARHVLAGRLCGRRLQSALTAVISSYFASPYIVGQMRRRYRVALVSEALIWQQETKAMQS
jgi:hypothetical protein